MAESALNKIKTTIINQTKKMGASEVNSLGLDIKSFFDELERKKIAQDERAEKIRSLIAEDSSITVSTDDVVRMLADLKAKKQKKISVSTKTQPEPKYKYTDEVGNVLTWSGRGKKPKALMKLLEEGNSLNQYLISKKDDWLPSQS